MLLDGHPVESARNFIAFIFGWLEFCDCRAREEALQFRPSGIGNRRALHLLADRVDQPHSLLLPKFGTEPEAILAVGESHGLIRSSTDCQIWFADVFLIVKTRRMQADGIVEPRDEAVWIRHQIDRGALVGVQACSIHQEFVLLCLAAKNRMIFENEAGSTGAGIPLKE